MKNYSNYMLKMKIKFKNITALAFFLLIANENTYAQGNDFIDAIKNLNLQGDDASITIQQGKNYSHPSNSNINDTSHTQDLVKKNLRLQQKYELLLGSYNEIKLSNKCQKLEHQKKFIENLKKDKNDIYKENISLRKQLAEIKNQLFVLRDERENSVTGNLTELVSLREVNTRLKSEAAKAHKQMTEVNTALANLQKDSETALAQKISKLTALGEENSRLKSKAANVQKQMTEINTALATLRKDSETALARKISELTALGEENSRLKSEAVKAQKQMAEVNTTLATLRKDSETALARKISELMALGEENSRLKSEAVKAQKQMAEVNTTLATLRKDSETALARKISELTALRKDNSHLETKIEKTEKQLLKTTSELENLKQLNDTATVYKDNALKTDKGIGSYSLGVFYYEKIDAEFKKIAHEKIDLDPSMMIAGINDAYRKSLKVNKNIIMENVVKIDKTVQTINSAYAKQIIKKINKNKYQVLQNRTFLVTEKTSDKKYTNDEIVTFDMLEKTLGGKPVLNTMNTKVRYSQVKDPLLLKIFTEGGKGGVMTLYGKAGDIYKNTPEGIEVEDLISISFILK